MITEQLEGEDGTVLRCHTNQEEEPVIYMSNDDNDFPPMWCVIKFENINEIDWLINRLNKLKKDHFGA